MIPIEKRNRISEILELPTMNPVDMKLAKDNYRRLIRQYHPDINKAKEAEMYTKKLNWAWGILTGKVKHNNPLPPPRPVYQPVVIHVTMSGTGYTWTGGSATYWW